MRANKFSYTFPDGRINTRNSKTMLYTHVVIGRRDVAADYARAVARAEATVRLNWAFHVSIVDGTYRSAVGRQYDTRTPEEIARSQAQIEGGIDAAIARAQAAVQPVAARDANLVVLQWSQSAANATKACGSWIKNGWHDVRVSPVDAVAVEGKSSHSTTTLNPRYVW